MNIQELSRQLINRYVSKAAKDTQRPDHDNEEKRKKRVRILNRASIRNTNFSEDVPTNATGANMPGTGDTGDAWKKTKKRIAKRVMDFYKGA